ncbi:MAG: hypothetical protein P4M11_07890 [Candidatus Pacebacteria bacterium]|nr:hypothetical protein [Candidatus Paceibacterota bacterium]
MVEYDEKAQLYVFYRNAHRLQKIKTDFVERNERAMVSLEEG